jgi:hypothetical protein
MFHWIRESRENLVVLLNHMTPVIFPHLLWDDSWLHRTGSKRKDRSDQLFIVHAEFSFSVVNQNQPASNRVPRGDHLPKRKGLASKEKNCVLPFFLSPKPRDEFSYEDYDWESVAKQIHDDLIAGKLDCFKSLHLGE